MLTLENIIAWEQLTGKKLQDFDGNSVEDVIALGYVQYAGRRRYTLEEYTSALLSASQTKELESVARAASLEFKYIAQFNKAASVEAEDTGNKEAITEVVGQLITAGMDGNFVLSRGLEDLRWLTEAAQAGERRKMENARFWAYLQLSPYLDKNKVKNVKDFLTFDWETPADNSTITDIEKKMAEALFKHNK